MHRIIEVVVHLRTILSVVFIHYKYKMSRIINCRSSNKMGRGSKNFDSPLLVDDQDQQQSSMMMTTTTSSQNIKRQYTWNEISHHSNKKDRWIVIDKRVYDITRWTKHPGGQVVLNHHAGQDATVRYNLFNLKRFVFSSRKLFVHFIPIFHQFKNI